MGWRVVVISNRAKLDYKMGHIVIRKEEEEKRICLDDISVLILESTAISLTAYLLAELTLKKIKVIFCDNEHNPLSELVPCRASYDTSGKIRNQITWGQDIKALIWQKIVREKIDNQASVLLRLGKDSQTSELQTLAQEVAPGDPNNREGLAAKIYFENIFDEEFFRNSDDIRNIALNYGYTILLSAFNREIAANGYLTQIGIWHDSSTNPFNLGSDLMEPWRPLIDYSVATTEFINFGPNEKLNIINILNDKVKIGGTRQYINNAITMFVHSIFDALESSEPSKIMFYSNEL